VLVTPPAVVYATGLLVICGPQRQLLDLNEIVGEMIALLPGEATH